MVVQSLSHIHPCNHVDCSMPDSPVLHHLPEFAQYMSIESVMLSAIPSSVTPFSFCLQSSPASGSFPMSWLFASEEEEGKVRACPNYYRFGTHLLKPNALKSLYPQPGQALLHAVSWVNTAGGWHLWKDGAWAGRTSTSGGGRGALLGICLQLWEVSLPCLSIW